MTGVIIIWKWRCLRSEMIEQDSDESIPSDESSKARECFVWLGSLRLLGF